MSSELKSVEITLTDVVRTIWNGKWVVFAGAIIGLVAAAALLVLTPPRKFVATTEIRPISSDMLDGYRAFNSLEFLEITEKGLLDLYVEQLQQRTLFEEAISKFDLLNGSILPGTNNIEESAAKLAGSVELLPPINVDGKERGPSRANWTIQFSYNYQEKWLNALTYVNQMANTRVREVINERFSSLVSSAKLKNKYEIEDISIAINNSISDYERIMDTRIAFLDEQAQIARSLGVPKNTLATQSYGEARTTIVTRIEDETPFYLRGYEAIEKEIDLIKKRKNPANFIPELLELQKKKRELEQDKTTERAELLFALTPAASQAKFKAARVSVPTTSFNYSFGLIKILMGAATVGAIAGAMLVVLRSMFTDVRAKRL